MNLPNYKKTYVSSIIHKQTTNLKNVVFLVIVYEIFCAKIKKNIFEHLWQLSQAIS